MILGAGRGIEPQGDPSIPMMVDYLRSKGFAAHAEVRGAVRYDLLRFRKREANLPHSLVDVPGHTRSLQRAASVCSMTAEELPTADLLQNPFSVSTAGDQPPAIAQGEHKRTAVEALGERDPAQVYQ